MGKTFQAAQLTHERFLTPDLSCEIFFFNICQTELSQSGQKVQKSDFQSQCSMSKKL